MITVYIKKAEPINEKTEEKILSSLSKSASDRLKRKRNTSLRLSSLCALSALTDEQRTDLEYTESGIPYFKTISKHVSISHSSIYCAVAISDCAVGIDIEDINGDAESQRLVRFFTENERKEVENGASPLKIWTKKEALFKYLKNDNINFISLDTTQANVYFETIDLNDAILSLYAEKKEKIAIRKL